jgi:hypothetical protein
VTHPDAAPERRGRPPAPPGPRGEDADSVNVVVVLFIIALVIGGVWVFRGLSERNEIENCIASGRHDCIKIEDFKTSP